MSQEPRTPQRDRWADIVILIVLLTVFVFGLGAGIVISEALG
jgi:hypothetical protein